MARCVSLVAPSEDWCLNDSVLHQSPLTVPRTVLEVVEMGKVKTGTGGVKNGLSCFDIWTECQSCPARHGIFLFQQTWVDGDGGYCALFRCLGEGELRRLRDCCKHECAIRKSSDDGLLIKVSTCASFQGFYPLTSALKVSAPTECDQLCTCVE